MEVPGRVHGCSLKKLNGFFSRKQFSVDFGNDNYIPCAHARYETHPKMIFPVRTQLTS